MPKKITYTEKEANHIQNYGEQHPNFHNAEMKRWRKKWVYKQQPNTYKKICSLT